MRVEPDQVLLIATVETKYDEPYRYANCIGDGHDDADTGHCRHTVKRNQEGEADECHDGTDTDHATMDPHVERCHIR